MSNLISMQWLDFIIADLKHFPTENRKKPYEHFQSALEESGRKMEVLILHIKNELFTVVDSPKYRKGKISFYHETVIYYLNEFYTIKQNHGKRSKIIKSLCDRIHNELILVLDFIEEHFKQYLKNNRKVSKYYLSTAKSDLKNLLFKMSVRSETLRCEHTKKVINIIFHCLKKFICTTKYNYNVTYASVSYRLEFIKYIMELPQWEPLEDGTYPLDNLLICFNFNSKSYIELLITSLSDNIHNTKEDKTEILLTYYKGIRQLHTLPGYIFNPEYHSITDLLNKWFEEELEYSRKISTLSTFTPPITENLKTSEIKPKVLCTLSADQIALILRAADEVRLLSARSLTSVFRSIVPHISTKQTRDLSYESVRTKSYDAEDRDKEITILILRKMIEKISDY